MKIQVLCIGPTKSKDIVELNQEYLKRLNHYCDFEFKILPDPKLKDKTNKDQRKNTEAKQFFNHINKGDLIILLDEKGKEYSSKAFANQIEKWQNRSPKKIIFIIGGPFGFDKEIYDRADAQLALSQMTFTHDMIRLFFTEQLYRAFTIIRNESYHH